MLCSLPLHRNVCKVITTQTESTEHAALAPGLQASTNTGSVPDCGPLIAAGEAKSKTCRLSADSKTSNKAKQLLRNQSGSTKPKSEGHSGGSKSIRGTTESKRSGWEGRAPTYIQNFSGSMHYLRAVVHYYTYKPSMNYFPDNDQKNSLNDSSSTGSTSKDVWWCERLLLLPWRNLPSPPQGRNRETTDEGRERREDSLQ